MTYPQNSHYRRDADTDRPTRRDRQKDGNS
jgi:hypothetical protein